MGFIAKLRELLRNEKQNELQSKALKAAPSQKQIPSPKPENIVPTRDSQHNVTQTPTTLPKLVNLGPVKSTSIAATPTPTQERRDLQVATPLARSHRRSLPDDLKVLMILGGAGTGKTTLIRNLIERDGGNQVVFAPTGVAAVNVGGQTIHSFFQIPPRIQNLEDITIKTSMAPLLRRVSRVIIDEISMVRADILDTVDQILKLQRGNDAPFGGVQMVLVGDFLQLPPVVPHNEAEMLAKMGYSTPYVFSAKCLEANPPEILQLSRVYRQRDPEYLQLLNGIRAGSDLRNTIDAFNLTCHGPHKENVVPVILTATNDDAYTHNARELVALTGAKTTFEGLIEGKFDLKDDKLPVPEFLDLKVGARVMTVTNDRNKQWVNGSSGTVTELNSNSVCIRLDSNDEVFVIEPYTWERVKYAWDNQTQKVVAKVSGKYTQIPLIHAWAITIHKSQGRTLDRARLDIRKGAFAHGQIYVALSRTRSMDNLSFTTPLTQSDVRLDKRVLEFLQNSRCRSWYLEDESV